MNMVSQCCNILSQCCIIFMIKYFAEYTHQKFTEEKFLVVNYLSFQKVFTHLRPLFKEVMFRCKNKACLKTFENLFILKPKK